jgi:predicted glycosyltransferase involved in capsule biosynthesis
LKPIKPIPEKSSDFKSLRLFVKKFFLQRKENEKYLNEKYQNKPD